MAARKKSGAASREIAIYLRLSSADGTEAESNSIGNQRSYLHQWAAREGWQIVAEFLDDGHTGTDFERPGFRALMAALQEKRITTFATTDLSRLGRNYLEVGLLQEKTFPTLGVPQPVQKPDERHLRAGLQQQSFARQTHLTAARQVLRLGPLWVQAGPGRQISPGARPGHRAHCTAYLRIIFGR